MNGVKYVMCDTPRTINTIYFSGKKQYNQNNTDKLRFYSSITWGSRKKRNALYVLIAMEEKVRFTVKVVL